jgi:hypothetical protein
MIYSKFKGGGNNARVLDGVAQEPEYKEQKTTASF